MRPRSHRALPPFLAAAALALIATGCEDQGGEQIQPVTGKVLVDGKPAARAKVSFHPSPPSPNAVIPYAVTGEDGTFRPSTRSPGDGAPSGNYTVTITWPEVKVEKGEEVAGRDRLHGSYNDPRSPVLQATILEGPNDLPPFDLKSQ